MAIIISDIHGDIHKAQAFLDYKPDAEHIILGDLVDSRNKEITLDDELACLDLIIASESKLLWGNHDLAYTLEEPWGGFTKFGWIKDAEVDRYISQSDYLRQKYQDNDGLWGRDLFVERYQAARAQGRFRAACAVEGWLCTHAGVGPGLANIIPPEIIAAGASEIASWLNDEFLRELKIPVEMTCDGRRPRHGVGPLFQIHRCRAGCDPYGGIFWFDPHGEITIPSPKVGRQVFGHTHGQYPEIGATWVNLDTFKGFWVFDTQENCLIEVGCGEKIPLGDPA